MAKRPTFASLKLNTRIGQEPILFKDAQAGMPPGGMQPDIGQSPVSGNPDEMQAPESANQRQYEDDFGQLAYQFVQDRAPALVPYLLGFEVVDRNEDGSKAVGIFGFKVDDDFYYIPCFFLNNQVRGVDMVLNKKTNQFVPLTEDWVDYIINRHAVSIGGPADDRVRDTMRNPDLSFVQRPQVALGKIASDGPWTYKQAWGRIKEVTAKIAQDPGFQEMLNGIGAAVKGGLAKVAESKYIKDFMEKVGGPEAMSGFLAAMHDIDFANAAMTLYKGAEAFWTPNLKNASIHVDRMHKIAAARPKVRIVDSTEGLAKVAQDTPKSDVGEEDKPLDVEENARQIVEHGFTIEDDRSDGETARVTDDSALVAFERRFTPPCGPGKYNFIMHDNVAREGIMLNAVVSPHCVEGGTLFLFEDDGEGDGFVCASAKPNVVLTTEFDEDQASTDDPLQALFDRAKPISSIDIKDSGDQKSGYVFIDNKGNAAGPFAFSVSLGDGEHLRLIPTYSGDLVVQTSADDSLRPHYGFMDWDLSDRYHDADGRRRDQSCCGCSPCDSNRPVTIGTFSGLPKQTSSGLIIPHDWKVVEVKSVRGDMYMPLPQDEDISESRKRRQKAEQDFETLRSKFAFGSIEQIMEAMSSEGVERIKIASDGADYYIQVDGSTRQHGPLTYKQASVDLVTRFGFRPRRAFVSLEKAAADRVNGLRLLVEVPSLRDSQVKEAQSGLVNVAMPAPAEQIPATDPYTGVPVYSSPYVDMTHGSFTGVPSLPPEGGLTHGINIGGEMARNMGGSEIPDEHNALEEGALPIDEEARRLAEEAAAAGQRHVFDQAAIGGLVKVYDVANVVDSYVPEFMDTIDRLGRILFLFYWKHEDFSQRYGNDDMVQMEDRIRNVFKSLGELALQLKEKSVQKQ